MTSIQIKRAYDPVAKADGFRVLVDRLWPRGVATEVLHADAWMKELAPSPSLRIWFKHHPDKWQIFYNSYLIELKVYANKAALHAFCNAHKKITLLYASKDELHNHAIILQQFLHNLQNNFSTSANYLAS
jgi:uncharacterized protein YeaO (DUF488 family)